MKKKIWKLAYWKGHYFEMPLWYIKFPPFVCEKKNLVPNVDEDISVAADGWGRTSFFLFFFYFWTSLPSSYLYQNIFPILAGEARHLSRTSSHDVLHLHLPPLVLGITGTLLPALRYRFTWRVRILLAYSSKRSFRPYFLFLFVIFCLYMSSHFLCVCMWERIGCHDS